MPVAANVAPHAQAPDAYGRLEALVNWESRGRGAMRPGLEAVLDLLQRLGHPQHRVRTVHVTGTKGKGSVCALVEAGLQAAGWRTGRYASPHVERLHERICLGGAPIADGALRTMLARVLDQRDAACLDGTAAAASTWFDVMTATAFASFADARLDWAVVEVGLGGLHDSTNVVLPELAVITNVELEHTDVLGPTLRDIARHKAGIAKRGRPLLSAVAPDHAARPVIAARAREVGAELVELDPRPEPGYPEQNLALARGALDLLGRAGHHQATGGRPLSARDLPAAVASTVHLAGRLERMTVPHPATQAALPVVVDGAHVPFAVTAVLDEMRRCWPDDGRPVVLLALASDKRAPEIVARLAGRVRACICTTLPCGRAAWDPGTLADLCGRAGLRAVAQPVPSAALAQALSAAGPGDVVLVTGSLALAGWALGPLQRRACPLPGVPAPSVRT